MRYFELRCYKIFKFENLDPDQRFTMSQVNSIPDTARAACIANNLGNDYFTKNFQVRENKTRMRNIHARFF